ncbi:MAG: glucose-6-phosphate isomerase [Dehalococcoidia bacterium]
MPEVAQADQGLATAVADLEQREVVRKLLAGDPSAWSEDGAVREKIVNRLGWIPVVREMAAEVDDLKRFAAGLAHEGYKYAVLLGMGGSSLAPIVLREVLASDKPLLKLEVIDTTDPETIFAVERRIDLDHTVFIVSSKSGGTIEPNTLAAYFWERTGGDGSRFIAVTDPDTELSRLAAANRYRRAFINRPDIGGRYSALSYFGLVPAALMGLDVGHIVGGATKLLDGLSDELREGDSPTWLGARLGALATAGRDKVTFVMDERLASLGLWLEQLIAESTGKEGKGLVPVAGERLGPVGVYGADRVFVEIGLRGSDEAELDDFEDAGHPVIRRTLKNPNDLGAEFLAWEIATAVAGAVLGINPFDEPNVQESKDNTSRLLDELQSSGSLPAAGQSAEYDTIAVTGAGGSAVDLVRGFLRDAPGGGYIALMAYVGETAERENAFQDIRTAIRDQSRLATTFGYGPRFLHSTGQLHKGGKQNGAYVQFVAPVQEDVVIPGRPFTFGQLIAAQSLGDHQALLSRGRPVLRIDLGMDRQRGLAAAERLFSEALTS